MSRSLKFVAFLVAFLCLIGGLGYWLYSENSTKGLDQKTTNSTASEVSRSPVAGTVGTATNYVGQFTFAGEPKFVAYPNPTERLANSAYLVAYDETRENPAWAAYRIPGERKFGPLPRPRRFSTDSRTQARISHDSYTNTGFDRGHMVPNLAIASRFGETAQAETFLMSNVVPQKPALNQGPWRLLEETLSETTAVHCSELWVIVGPVYEEPTKRMPSGPVIPSAFFMLIADDTPSGPRLQAFLIPQSASRGDDFRQFRTTVQVVQQKTGLDFFSELPDTLEQKLEGEVGSYWLED